MSFSELVVALIEQAWTGNAEAFEKLYHILYRYLVTYTGDPDTACDIAQETLIKAWEKWPSVRNVAHAKKWLFTIATRLAIDYSRRKKPSHSLSLLQDGDDDYDEVAHLYVTKDDELPEECIMHMEERRLVRLAIAQVSPEFRDCLILNIVEDSTQAEIAKLLERDIRTVQRHISRGKEELRQAYLRLSNG
jgi:RNA polymerase sigma-70 factor, ECF subfamily